MRIEYVATCLFGLEHLLGEEIDALGFTRLSTIDGRITFAGEESACARANVFLRYAERVYIRVGGFRAESFDQLFEGVRALPWELWIGREDAFPVKGHSVKSRLFSIPDCQKIIKRAVVAHLSDCYGLLRFPETGVRVQIEFFLLRDEATLMIDTSGDPLHKRGYRTEANAAPLRETLAAAVASIARPREEVLLWDPLCGSGTIAIEAAMRMRGIAPGARRRFAGEELRALPRPIWEEAREEARSGEHPSDFEVYASDIDPACVELTRRNAARAGVADTVHSFVCDARTLEKPDRRGTIVTNPPYGERLMERGEVEELYRALGRRFIALSPWQVYILTSHPGFERLYGRRADKTRKLYNGMIPCYLYQFFKNNTRERDK